MTAAEAAAAVREGQTVRVVVGYGLDPTLLVWEQERMVWSASVAGWSAGVVEAVCGIDSDFLRTYMTGREVVVEDDGPPAWARAEVYR